MGPTQRRDRATSSRDTRPLPYHRPYRSVSQCAVPPRAGLGVPLLLVRVLGPLARARQRHRAPRASARAVTERTYDAERTAPGSSTRKASRKVTSRCWATACARGREVQPRSELALGDPTPVVAGRPEARTGAAIRSRRSGRGHRPPRRGSRFRWRARSTQVAQPLADEPAHHRAGRRADNDRGAHGHVERDLEERQRERRLEPCVEGEDGPRVRTFSGWKRGSLRRAVEVRGKGQHP